MTTSPASPSYAVEVAGLLWPSRDGAPCITRSAASPDPGRREAYVFPSARNPRLLVPVDLPAASTMLQRLGNDSSPFVQPMRSVLQTSVRSPAFRLSRWPRLRIAAVEEPLGSIEDHLEGILDRPVRVGVVLGPRRVNQKPVLQIFALDGSLLGYAKVGHNALTAGLVRHEAAALASIGELSPRTFRAPRLLHHGTWSGLEVLVMSALPTDAGHRVGSNIRVPSMLEVAGLGGLHTRRLSDSSFWSRLRASALTLSDVTDGADLATAVATIEATYASTELTFGGWHGDWGGWNMGLHRGVLQLWDWERYDADVPLGFDGLHFIAQRVFPGRRGDAQQEAAFLRSVPDGLTAFGVDPAEHALVLRLYLLEIATRYVEALTHGASPGFALRTSWVRSLLARLLQQPHTRMSEGRP